MNVRTKKKKGGVKHKDNLSRYKEDQQIQALLLANNPKISNLQRQSLKQSSKKTSHISAWFKPKPKNLNDGNINVSGVIDFDHELEDANFINVD